MGCNGFADEETYPVLQVSVFEKSDSVSHDLPPRACTKLARRQTCMSAQVRRQMSLIGIARFRRDIRETFRFEGNSPHNATETLNGCILLGGKPCTLAKMTLERAGNDTEGSGQRSNPSATIHPRRR
jgi:hypothetical protein